MTHMYGKEVSGDISAAQEAQRVHDVNTFRQDRRWMYGVDLMPKRVSMLDIMVAQIRRQRQDGKIEQSPDQWEYM